MKSTEVDLNKEKCRNIADSVKLMDKETLKTIDLVHSIDEVSSKTIDEVFERIKSDSDNIYYYAKCIEYALKIRPNQTEILVQLLNLVSKEFEYVQSDILSKEHKNILIKRGIINPELKFVFYHKLNINDDIFLSGSFEEAIKEDNVDFLVKISNNHDFNPNMSILVKKYHHIYHVKRNMENSEWNNHPINVTLMQLIAFFGAVKCFKYAQLNYFNEDKIEKYAIAGGNNEIIRSLERNGHSFKNCFDTAIKYHRNNLADWILNNYNPEVIELNKAIIYNNIEAFFFTVDKENSSKIYLYNEIKLTAFQIACVTGCLPIVKYLISEYNIDINSFSERYNDCSPLNYACKEGNFHIVKYLIEECNADMQLSLKFACKSGSLTIVKYLVEERNASIDKSAIVDACESGNVSILKYLIEEYNIDVKNDKELREKALNIACYQEELSIIKYLVENCNADVEHELKISVGTLAIHIAASRGNIPMVKYLVERCHADVNAKAKLCDGKTALHFAVENLDFPMVKFLIEECHADVNAVTSSAVGLRSIFYAVERNNLQMLKYLIEDAHAEIDKNTEFCRVILRLSHGEIRDYLLSMLQK